MYGREMRSLTGSNSRFRPDDALPLLGCAVPGVKSQKEFPHLLPQRRNDTLGKEHETLTFPQTLTAGDIKY